MVVGALYIRTGALTPCGAVRSRLEVELAAGMKDASAMELLAATSQKDALLDLTMARYDLNQIECGQAVINHFSSGIPMRLELQLVEGARGL